MSIMMDYIAAAIIFGILALTIARIQTNLNVMMYQNTYRYSTQTFAIELARQMEHDFLKIGYHVKGQKIFAANSTHIQYRADVANNNKDTVIIDYSVGTVAQANKTTNPRDFPIIRTYNGTSATQFFGITKFKLNYYNKSLSELSVPVTGSYLDSIRFINAMFVMESPEPIDQGTGDTTLLWARISWEKLLTPRNLNNVNY